MIKEQANKIMLVRPTSFGINSEILEDNKFVKLENIDSESTKILALVEFEEFRRCIEISIEVDTFDQIDERAIDSIFPNNWFSTHRNKDFPDGLLIIYPMMSKVRRLEKQPSIIIELKKSYLHFEDLSYLEEESEFLESTGSLIIDSRCRKIYCSISQRSTEKAIQAFMKVFNKYALVPYKLITFISYDSNTSLIYHTNVLLSILEKHIVVCIDAIDKENRACIKNELAEDRKLIEVSFQEMNNFCCNILNVASRSSESTIIMSERAYESFSKENIDELMNCYKILHVPINTIENVGGGSARCMIAELY